MNKALNMLGMAMRARKLSVGDTVLEDIRKNKAKLVVIASDASDNTKKRLIDKCTFYRVDYCFIESSSALSQAIGKTNCKAVSILEVGFAKTIASCLKG